MAKQKPEIVGTVRLGEKLYTPGMEKELEKVLTREQAVRLIKKGVIVGVDLPADEDEEETNPPKGKGSKAPSGDSGTKNTDLGNKGNEPVTS